MIGSTTYGPGTRTTATDVGPVPQGVNMAGIYDLFRRMMAARSAPTTPTPGAFGSRPLGTSIRSSGSSGSRGASLSRPTERMLAPAQEEGEDRFGTIFSGGSVPQTTGTAYMAWRPGSSAAGGNAPVYMGRW